jgi:hypothetical protein
VSCPAISIPGSSECRRTPLFDHFAEERVRPAALPGFSSQLGSSRPSACAVLSKQILREVLPALKPTPGCA